MYITEHALLKDTQIADTHIRFLFNRIIFSELLQVTLLQVRPVLNSKLLGIAVAERFTDLMHFLSLNHQCQSTEGIHIA